MFYRNGTLVWFKTNLNDEWRPGRVVGCATAQGKGKTVRLRYIVSYADGKKSTTCTPGQVKQRVKKPVALTLEQQKAVWAPTKENAGAGWAPGHWGAPTLPEPILTDEFDPKDGAPKELEFDE